MDFQNSAGVQAPATYLGSITKLASPSNWLLLIYSKNEPRIGNPVADLNKDR
jgi:hypothetical protein